MITIFKGTYLVFGEDVEPRVVLLTEREYQLHIDRTVVCRYHRRPQDALVKTFGDGIDSAFRAWDEATMSLIGQKYEGPHQARVRALAAAIVLGITFEELLNGRKGGNGGEKVTQPKRPRKPRPGGIAVPIPVSQSA